MTAILYFFYFITLSSSSVGHATISPSSHLESDTIYWSPSSKLTWSDFRAKNFDSSVYKRFDTLKCHIDTYSKVGITFSFKFENKKPFFIVSAVFIRSGSWSSVDDEPETLLHEQGHFDMAEIYSRRLRDEMLKYQDLDLTQFIKTFYEKYTLINTNYLEESMRFDLMTTTSLHLHLYLKEIKKRLEASEIK